MQHLTPSTLKPILSIVFTFFVLGLYAQIPSQETLIQEAKKRNIVTKEQALKALIDNGISQNQAKALAREKGISLDEFLESNFESTPKSIETSTAPDPDNSILDTNSSFSESVVENREVDKEGPSAQDFQYFGYSIFDNNPYLEKEYLLGNIDEGYLLAPGDALRVIVFGNNSLELEAVVDRNGNINIPGYGVFFAAGNTFKTLKNRLQTYLGKYFSGLLTSPQNTFLDVSLTQLKPTKVVVVGQVNAPGSHILTTQANPLAALYAAGGVKTSGSLREIRIYRNNKLYKTIDLYDYITSGALNEDVYLTNNDIVFIPPRASSVLLSGEVENEGYYELKSGEYLSDLVGFSGGLPVSTARDRVNILRVDPAKESSDFSDKTLLTVNYKELLLRNKDFAIYDGDQVTFIPLLEEVSNIVTIEGNVNSPGEYSLNSFSDLKALIVNAARGVKEDTYFDKVDVKGVILPSGKKTFASYNLSDILSGKTTIALNDKDNITVYSNSKVEGSSFVYLSGYGVEIPVDYEDDAKAALASENSDENPLTSEEEADSALANEDETENSLTLLWSENLSLYDLIFENTSFNSLTFRKNLFDSRIDVKSYDYETRRYTTSPYNFGDTSLLKRVYLKPFDRVVIYNKNIVEQTDIEIAVSGYVNRPGSFELEKNMYVEDAILLAGGFSNLADQGTVYVNREEKNPDTEITSVKYVAAIDMDYIMGLKEVPSDGFVLGPNDIVTIPKNLAFEKQQSITVSGEVLYPRTVVAESKLVSLNYLFGEVGGLTDFAYLKSSYVKRADKILSLDLSQVNRNKALFMDKDELVISKNFGSVSTEGAVENASIFNWEKGKRAKYYLRNSGGKLSKLGAKAFVLNSNGKTKKIKLFNNPRVSPDSKIVVNYKQEKVKGEGKFLDDATNILGAVTGALTTILLLERL